MQGEDRAHEADRDTVIFTALYSDLRRFAAATGSIDVDPDDLVQEAVARTLRLHPLSALDDPGAYLRRAIVGLASNHRRSMGRLRSALSRLAAGHQDASYPEYPSDVAELMRLSARDRAALYLREVEGAPYQEIADVLGSSEAAARMTVSRARRRLRIVVEEGR